MKHFLLMTYSIYFACLMIVPCNHTLLYTQIMENVVGINMHEKCSHEASANNENHQHHNEHSNHHHACTPFCSCGTLNFVLHVPQFQAIPALSIALSRNTESIQSNVWAIPADNYKKLMPKDIWHPPQTV